MPACSVQANWFQIAYPNITKLLEMQIKLSQWTSSQSFFGPIGAEPILFLQYNAMMIWLLVTGVMGMILNNGIGTISRL